MNFSDFFGSPSAPVLLGDGRVKIRYSRSGRTGRKVSPMMDPEILVEEVTEAVLQSDLFKFLEKLKEEVEAGEMRGEHFFDPDEEEEGDHGLEWEENDEPGAYRYPPNGSGGLPGQNTPPWNNQKYSRSDRPVFGPVSGEAPLTPAEYARQRWVERITEGDR